MIKDRNTQLVRNKFLFSGGSGERFIASIERNSDLQKIQMTCLKCMPKLIMEWTCSMKGVNLYALNKETVFALQRLYVGIIC